MPYICVEVDAREVLEDLPVEDVANYFLHDGNLLDFLDAIPFYHIVAYVARREDD